MIRRPPRSTLSSSSAASDVYKRQPKNSPEDAPPRSCGKPVQVRFDSAVCVVQACGAMCHTLAMDVDGRVFAWGDNCHDIKHRPIIGRLGVPSKSEPFPRQVCDGAMEGAVIRMVAAGANHSLALTEGGKVIFWGWLRRPRDWEAQGFGHIQTGAQLVPGLVPGGWEKSGGSVVYVGAGANKAVVIVDPKLPALGGEDLPSVKVAADEAGQYGRTIVRAETVPLEESQAMEIKQLKLHNEKLEARVDELEAVVERARAIFARYLPHAVDSLDMC
eukprot:TRINITY_DN2972_c0_g1_i3.p1 TRINITY_DN2972_c0_g1~~TRINITY_DN2972_c0_g1_i3.p1  ORF type:complete len:274 (+),score=73.46 TRINITY_DN2972_c0_g1_i3:127-948(+)